MLSMLGKNWCQVAFTYAFAPSLAAFSIVPLEVLIFGRPQSPDYSLVLFLTFLSFLATYVFIGRIIYKRYIGPRLRVWGWDENSYFRGLQVALASVLVLWLLPVVSLAILDKLNQRPT